MLHVWRFMRKGFHLRGHKSSQKIQSSGLGKRIFADKTLGDCSLQASEFSFSFFPLSLYSGEVCLLNNMMK
jgi:hypothetical protein